MSPCAIIVPTLALLLVAAPRARAAADLSKVKVRADYWLEKRRALIDKVFGSEGGELPSRSMPDAVEAVPGPNAQGCLCSERGFCNASECVWSNNMTKLTWTITQKLNSTYTLTLNSTVFHTLNTSGVAPGIWANGINMPKNPLPAKKFERTLVLFHQGHAEPHDLCSTDNYGEVDWLNQLGFDVMELEMPLLGCNAVPDLPYDLVGGHNWFQKFDDDAPVMRFFLEPIILTINYAIEHLGYDNVVMAGLSGGGWSTTVASAMDPRIKLSFPVAGSIPCEFDHTSWDFEQYGACGAKGVTKWPANYTEMYVLAALEPDRYSFQVIHEFDSCCFRSQGRHGRIIEYNTWVQTQTAGRFQTTPTVGNIHEVNWRDKTIIGGLLSRYLKAGKLTEADWGNVPFDILRAWGP